MSPSPNLSTLPDVIAWAYYHEGVFDQQEAANQRVENQLKTMDTRLSMLERRMAWLAGLAAGAGGIAGNMVMKLFT